MDSGTLACLTSVSKYKAMCLSWVAERRSEVILSANFPALTNAS